MCSYDLLDYRFEFFIFCLIYSIVQIFTKNRKICWDLHYVHSVNITEFFFFCKGSTCHTTFLFIFVKQILECDCRKCLALSFYFYMLFRFDCLMKTVRITTSRHNTSGKFIYDHNLIIRHNIILISEHQIVCTKRQNNVMLNL